jgi:hypothetical protein
LTTVVAAVALGIAAGSALAAPAYDDFANAQALTGNRGFFDFDLTGATNESGEPLTGDPSDVSGWFSYSPSADGFASFSTCRKEADLVTEGLALNLYSGGTLATLSSEAHATGGCKNGRVNVTTDPIAVQSGHVYFLQVEFAASAEITGGHIDFDFNTGAPANDDFADAAPITGALPQTLDADNGLASIENGEPDTEDWGPRNSLWWTWTPDQDGLVAIDSCSSVVGTNIDSRIHVYTDGDPDPDITTPSYVADNDDGCPSPNTLLSQLYVNVTSGETYFIRLSNYSADFGSPYKLKLRWVTTPELARPPYIDPSDARLRVGAMLYGSVGDWTGNPAIDSEDYQWKRCDASGNNCDVIDGETSSTYVTQSIDLGHRLVFVSNAHRGLEDFTADSAPSGLVADPPANDNLADAIDLGSSAPATVASDDYFSTLEAGEDIPAVGDIDGSVWYRWTAPASRVYYADNCSEDSDSSFQANVFTTTGSDFSDLSIVSDHNGGCDGTGNGNRAFFTAEAGTTYLIQVSIPSGTSPAEFSMTIAEAPAPSFFGTPQLQGSLLEGTNLTAVFSGQSSPIPTQKSIVWKDCQPDGSNCSTHPDTGVDLALTHSLVGRVVKATMTLTNANGSTSQTVTSGVIIGDGDGDSVPDDDDTCPSEAGSRPNGCDPSVISNDALPEISGSTVVGQELTGSTGEWSVAHDPLGYALSYQWQRCDSEAACSDIIGAEGESYSLVAADRGKFIRVVVTAENDDDAEPATSALTGAITDPPVTPPVGGGGGDGGSTPPPPSANPLTLTVKKSLGNLTPKKGVLTIKGAVVACAASATGPCTGKVTISATKGSKKYIEVAIYIAPAKTAPVVIKLKSSVLKKLKKSGPIKSKLAFTVAAPGFPAVTANATATIKPQK